jgi:apolipoprotein D and lipocalin family protein
MVKILKPTIIIALFYTLTILAQNDMKKAPPVTVNYVDLQKYSGLWYEIAKIPNSFQDQCKYGTTAEYIIKKDDDITVINKCYEEDGEIDVAEGVANIVDTKTNSKLEVSFVSFLGIRPFWGDYWIIGLDEDYTYAVIGDPERKYGWILSRKPSLPEETLTKIFELLKSQGYDPQSFELSVHKK